MGIIDVVGASPVTTVELTPAEMLLAATTGVHRHVAAVRRGLPDRNGHDGAGWNLHIEGSCGEMAFATAMGVFWSSSVNTFHSGADVRRGLQVRTRSKHEYELIVRRDDDPQQIYVLVTGIAPKFIIRGWVKGERAMQDRWWQEHGGRPGAWFVPHSGLFPINSLRVALDIVEAL